MKHSTDILEGIFKATMVDHYNNGSQINHISCIHTHKKRASVLKTLLEAIRGDVCHHERAH